MWQYAKLDEDVQSRAEEGGGGRIGGSEAGGGGANGSQGGVGSEGAGPKEELQAWDEGWEHRRMPWQPMEAEADVEAPSTGIEVAAIAAEELEVVSHSHTLAPTPSHPHPRTLTSSHPRILTLTPSYPLTNTSSYPRTLTLTPP